MPKIGEFIFPIFGIFKMLNSALQMTQGALKSLHLSGLVERFTRLTNDLTTEPMSGPLYPRRSQ